MCIHKNGGPRIWIENPSKKIVCMKHDFRKQKESLPVFYLFILFLYSIWIFLKVNLIKCIVWLVIVFPVSIKKNECEYVIERELKFDTLKRNFRMDEKTKNIHYLASIIPLFYSWSTPPTQLKHLYLKLIRWEVL